MSNNKQSSVEWLFNKLLLMNPNLLGFGDYLEQAKAMHKEEMIKNCAKMQIIDDVDFDGNVTFIFDPEKNYNETFGDNNEQQ